MYMHSKMRGIQWDPTFKKLLNLKMSLNPFLIQQDVFSVNGISFLQSVLSRIKVFVRNRSLFRAQRFLQNETFSKFSVSHFLKMHFLKWRIQLYCWYGLQQKIEECQM